MILLQVNTFWRDDKITLVQNDISSKSTHFDGMKKWQILTRGFKIRFQLYVELISRKKLFGSNVSVQKVWQLRWINWFFLPLSLYVRFNFSLACL